MARVDPSFQRFFSIPDGKIIGVTRFKIAQADNTVQIAPPSRNAQSGMICQVRDSADAAISTNFYIDPSGALDLNGQASSVIGQEVTCISIHPDSNGDS